MTVRFRGTSPTAQNIFAGAWTSWKGTRYGVRFQGIGGKFQIIFADQEVSNYREALAINQAAYDLFRKKMMAEGVLFHPSALFHHGITSSHSKEDLSSFLEKFGEFLNS
ncbi:MAG: hypothetical protein OK474_06415 [Thaumarchaeota archaeon]|nr:hypothetical protein [Nitrososphaerota archaeon]